jgi:hypothetical protein
MSEMKIDLEALMAGSVGAHELITKGALDSQVGKTIPVTIGEGDDKRIIGEAVIFKDGEGVSASIFLNPPKKD